MSGWRGTGVEAGGDGGSPFAARGILRFYVRKLREGRQRSEDNDLRKNRGVQARGRDNGAWLAYAMLVCVRHELCAGSAVALDPVAVLAPWQALPAPRVQAEPPGARLS